MVIVDGDDNNSGVGSSSGGGKRGSLVFHVMVAVMVML